MRLYFDKTGEKGIGGAEGEKGGAWRNGKDASLTFRPQGQVPAGMPQRCSSPASTS